MTTRLLALGILILSAVLAWLTISFTLAARLLQLAIVLSIAYVGYLAWRGWRGMRMARLARQASVEAADLPWISLVVPARDEEAVIGRLLEDLAALRYGTPPCFEAVVVDDASTDATLAIVQEAARDAPTIRVVVRPPGAGPATKGAVLAYAHPYLRGDIVGVVDADARFGPDLLIDVVRAWERDPSAAALQVLRRPGNAGDSWFTAAQLEEHLMDMASQCGRRATDGTAELRGNGMFVRREALDAVGGWGERTLTEDLELSSRLSLAGRHIGLAPEVSVGEQAVDRLRVLWRQRMRWAEGSIRRLMEHGPRLLASPIPIKAKVDFLVFTTEFVVPPLFVATAVASVATIVLPGPADWTVPASLLISYGVGTFLLALGGLAADGRRGAATLGGAARGALFLSHWLLVVPAVLARIAFRPETTDFAKTPRLPDR